MRPHICICLCCWPCGPANAKATCSAFRGPPMTATHIRLSQAKAGRPRVISVGAPLKAALDATPKRSTIILTTSCRQAMDLRRLSGFMGQGMQSPPASSASRSKSLRGTAVSGLHSSACDRRQYHYHHWALATRRARDPRHALSPAATRSSADSAITKLERGEFRIFSPD